MNHNILIAGVGGQGTVLASRLIAQCAMSRDLFVRTAETIGMAQRGGSVFSHVRIGENIPSPLIPLGGAQLIIGFEPAETVRVLPYLSKDGAVIVNMTAVKPVTDALSKSNYRGEDMLKHLESQLANLLQFDGTGLVRECGVEKALNIALIGAAAGQDLLGFTPEEVLAAIEIIIPERYRAANIQVFKTAYQISREKLGGTK